MSRESMKLKSKINQLAQDFDLPAQVVLQNYMFERFLERLSRSNYSANFILKGGVLISVMVGLQNRSTMDIDTTLHNYPMDLDSLQTAMIDICKTEVYDQVTFLVQSFNLIHQQDPYGGVRVRLMAIFEEMKTPLMIDISSGDSLYPGPIRQELGGLLNEKIRFSLWCYPVETVLAEKLETIFSRGALNTRAKDYYDVHILTKQLSTDKLVMDAALLATTKHRQTSWILDQKRIIFHQIVSSVPLQNQWKRYQQRFPFARTIGYDELMNSLGLLMGIDSIGKPS